MKQEDFKRLLRVPGMQPIVSRLGAIQSEAKGRRKFYMIFTVLEGSLVKSQAIMQENPTEIGGL